MIIVTGAAGFIGSVLVKYLNQLGRDDLLLVDQYRTGDKWKNLRGLKYEEFVEPQNFIDVLQDLDNVEAIFHLGACSNSQVEDMDYLYHNNVMFSKEIFAYCAKKDVSLCWASSAETYGHGEVGFDDSHDSIQKLRAQNKIAYSKQLFDEWALKQNNQPTRFYGFKFFKTYGPNEYHKGDNASEIYKIFNQIQETGKVVLEKNAKEILCDFIYVKDLVRGMIELMTSEKELENGIYNLGTGKARSIYDVASTAFKTLGLESKIELVEVPASFTKHQCKNIQAKMDKFHSALPHFEFCTLEEGMNDYYKRHLKSSNPYLEIQHD